MQNITKEQAENFIKYLEGVGVIKTNSHKEPDVVETVQAVCALDDDEFKKSEFATSYGANYFHSEYQDYLERGEDKRKH